MNDLYIVYLGFLKMAYNFLPATILIITAWIVGIIREIKRHNRNKKRNKKYLHKNYKSIA